MKEITNFILLSSFLLSNQIQFIPFDWGDQFGYVKHKGMIIWGEDWRSKNLLFDGTWSIFPRMYGENIEQGFLKIPHDKFTLDSSNVISNITYDQGDYGLDKFSIGINYFEKNRHLELQGFKRSYFGNFNQYYLNTSQPLQQSYTFSYKSLDTHRHTGLSIGHFNTLAGFPDLNINGIFDNSGIFDNRITSLNYFWSKEYGPLFFDLTMDHFLQRYKAIHSLSYYNRPRYLNRTVYKAEVNSLINGYTVSLGFNTNYRTTVSESKIHTDWYNLYSSAQWKSFDLWAAITKNENDFFYDYNFSFDKKFNSFRINIVNAIRSFPRHPFFIFNNEEMNKSKFYQKFYNQGFIQWEGLKSNVSMLISYIEDKQEFGQDSSFLHNQYSNIKLIYRKNLNSKIDVLLKYNIADTGNYYSGGIGKEVGLEFQSRFTLFSKFMTIDLNSELKYLYERINYSTINPIEMVPLITHNKDHEKLNPLTLINANLNVSVSSIMFGFNWINISEILLSTIGFEDNNFIIFHPNMPSLGRQINFSINWKFQD